MVESFNPNPRVFAPAKKASRTRPRRNPTSFIWMTDDILGSRDRDEECEAEPIDEEEIFELVRHISDPEHHGLTLEDLAVVSEPQIEISQERNLVVVEFTPTVPHCGMSTLIGLCLRVRLLRSLPQRFKVDIRVKPGSHNSEHAVNKQLNDKERVAAALENNALLDAVDKCLSTATLET